MKYAYPKIIVDLKTHYGAFIHGAVEDKKRALRGDEVACIEILDDTYENSVIKWRKDEANYQLA